MVQNFFKQKKSSLKENKSFTLIELLVVVAIIVILIGAISVTFDDTKKKARDNRAKSDLRAIVEGLELKYNDLYHYPDLPDIPTPIASNDHRLASYLDPVPNSNKVRTYYWYDDGTAQPQKFCVYFQLESNDTQYFTCSHKGCQIADNNPTCLDF